MYHSIYTLADGIFTGRRVGGDAEFVADHTPAGCGALAGRHDHRRVRIDLATGEVVPFRPPAPADHAFATWEWNEPDWEWVAVPTDAAIAFEVREERTRRLAACDWVVARAVDRGEPVPTEWTAYRAALREIPDQAGFPRAVEWPAPPG